MNKLMLMMIVVAICVAGSAQALLVWDAADDFHAATNASTDMWQYRAGARDADTLFTFQDTSWWSPWSGGVAPEGWNNGDDTTPMCVKNTSGADTNWNSNVYVLAGDILVAPSVGNLNVISWTSPITGVVDISWEVIRGQDNANGDGVEYYVDLNNAAGNIAALSGVLAQATGLPTTGVLTQTGVAVNIGDEILFIIASGASGAADITSLGNATITEVPEPATMALLGLGSLVMLRRKKSS